MTKDMPGGPLAGLRVVEMAGIGPAPYACLLPVSYTHLDVYKRQAYVSPGRLPNRPANQDVRLPALGDGSMELSLIHI